MKRTILATDLDGTFLGGSADQRRALYDWIGEHRDELMLIYVSGRSLATMRDVLEELPFHPDHVIADVGTTVLSGPAWQPMPALQTWLDARWSWHSAVDVARYLANAYPALEPQPVVEGRRLSYFFTPGEDLAALSAAVEAAGFDALASGGRYFDVLPRGVNKGSTLLRTLDALGLPRDRTLVAGDTLNDLSLFQTGLRGVAMVDSEPALLHAVAGWPHVRHSQHPGAAAILPELHALHGTAEVAL